jgi:hypothetical protein
MPTRSIVAVLGLGLACLALTASAPAAGAKSAGKRCCKVDYSGGTATVSGTIRIPAGAELMHIGMDPPVGACAVKGSRGTIAVSKTLKLRRTVRGYYRFVYTYRKDGELIDKQTRGVFVKGKLSPEE